MLVCKSPRLRAIWKNAHEGVNNNKEQAWDKIISIKNAKHLLLTKNKCNFAIAKILLLINKQALWQTFILPPPHSFQRGRKTLFMRRVLAILALILGTCSSFAQKYEIIDEYRYQLRNDEAILTSNSTWKYTGDIVVPSKVKASDGKSYKVTGIDDRCFQNCKTVTSVTLPSTISKIGQYCFADCEQMKSVNIPSAIKTISQYTFDDSI